MCGYAEGLLNSITHITVFNRVLVIQFDVRTILLYVTTVLLHLHDDNVTPLCHDSITPLHHDDITP